MPTRRAVELPVTVLISLIQKEKLGEPHVILAGGERYVSPRFQQEADRALRQSLDEARVDDDFRDTLALLQRARVEFYGWITAGEETMAALVAGSGRAAVTVIRNDDTVRFEQADPDRLVETLIMMLPEVPAGRGESISLRAGDYAPPPAGQETFLKRPTAARSKEARRLDALLQAPRLGGAKLYAAGRDNAGARLRAKEWITVLDLEQLGRWAVYSTEGQGAKAINAVPGTPRMLATKLAELQRSIRPRS
jgi:hypothetical protein